MYRSKNFRNIIFLIVICAVLAEVSAVSVRANEVEVYNNTVRNEDVEGMTFLSGSCGANAVWSLDGDTLTISGSGAMTDYSESDPAPWHDSCGSIRTLVIADGITHIGALSFYQCTALTAVTLSDSVVSIGNVAFSECSSLCTVTFGSSLSSIGKSAFEGCTSLSAVRFPSSLVSLGERAFFRCSSLGGAVLPESTTELGAMAFAYCTGLSSATIRGNITELPYWFFYGCTSLTSVYLPDSLETIGDRAFGGCSLLATIDCGSAQSGVKEAISEAVSGSEESYTGEISNKEYYHTDAADITVSRTSYEYADDSGAGLSDEVTVSAVIEDDAGWEELTDVTEDMDSSATVDVYYGKTELAAGVLSSFYGQEAVLTIHTGDDTVWQIALADQTEEALSEKQDLSVSVEKNETVSSSWKKEIGDADSFTVTIGNTTLNATVYIPVGAENAGRVATLYAVKSGKLEKLGSSIVSDSGTAAFSLSETGGKYVLALDVDGIATTEAVISQDLYGQYGGDVTLTDVDGNAYIIDGTTSSLPFTLRQMILMAVGAMAAAVVVVAVVMTALHKRKTTSEF
ncbi:MAG: leucine-rich repeat domain-containing protein [Clostridiales bacterium]|nr:leucine-rich repeat domain-containing protein [Clostridiales bacterium]